MTKKHRRSKVTDALPVPGIHPLKVKTLIDVAIPLLKERSKTVILLSFKACATATFYIRLVISFVRLTFAGVKTPLRAPFALVKRDNCTTKP